MSEVVDQNANEVPPEVSPEVKGLNRSYFQKEQNKWAYWGLGVVGFGLIIILGLVGFHNKSSELAEPEMDRYQGPSAKVYGEAITDQEFNDRYVSYQTLATQYPDPLTLASVRERTLRKCISDIAFKRELVKAGSKAAVDYTEVDDIIKKRWPTKETLQSAMKENNKTSENEFKSWLYEQYKYRKFVILKCRELGFKIPKEQVEAGLEKIKVSHILVATNHLTTNQVLRTDTDALKIAGNVYERVTNGFGFAVTAQLFSDDPTSKDKGGTYGPYTMAQFKNIGFVKEFVDAVLALKEGQISKPVKTQFGYHIIKLDERVFPKGAAYETQYRKIEDNLLYANAQDPNGPFIQWINDIDQKALKNIEVLDPGLRAYRSLKTRKYKEAVEEYEAALKRKYYQDKIEMYLDASESYLQLKKYELALKVLKRAPAKFNATFDYLVALAKIYQAQGQSQKAQDILTQYSDHHPKDEPKHHTRLKELFTEWNMTAAAEKESKILEAMNQLDEKDSSN